MGLNVMMEHCDTAGRGAGVNGRVKMKTNKTDLSQKSPKKKSLAQTQKAAVMEKKLKT